MKSDILVTVLMPCYNAEQYLHKAIDSIINQSYRNIEVLLINDGSSDATGGIIEAYALLDKRVKPHHNEHNIGLIKTLNKGIDLATGSYIARMDADDISALNRIEVQLEVLINNPEIDVISAGYHYISETDVVLRRVYPKALDSDALMFVSFFCTPVNHPCVLVKSQIFKQNSYDDQFIHSEDYEIFSRLLLSGIHFLNLEEPLYFLRKNTESVSYKFEKIQISTHTKISARNIDIYFNKSFDYFVHKVMINRISFNVSPVILKSAIAALSELKVEFNRRKKLSPNVMFQIDDFLVEQKIDIFLQSLKYAFWLNKLVIVFIILGNFHIFVSPRGRQYLRTKFINSKKKIPVK